jgi:hypothetical protein
MSGLGPVATGCDRSAAAASDGSEGGVIGGS